MEKLYDLTKLEEVTKGDKEFMNKMIQLFVNTVPGVISTMEKNLSHNDYTAIAASAHQIKPSIGYICISGLHDTVKEIEQWQGSDQTMVIKTEQFIASLKIVLDQLPSTN